MAEGQKRQKTQNDATEVVHLSEYAPNPGLQPAPGTGKATTEKGPPHTQPLAKRPNVIDFENIFRESGMIPTSSLASAEQIEPGPTQSSQEPSTPFNGTLEPPTNLVGEPLRLGSEDMSCHMPSQICQKIWTHQYFNIHLLLKGAVELQSLCSGGLLHITNQGFLEARALESRSDLSKDKVPNIEKWTDAFLVFTSIYLMKYPHKAQELLQYMNIIQEAASRSPSFASLAWRSYDEQFQIHQASSPQPWDKLNPDLWLRVMTSTSFSGIDTPQVAQANCLDFNNGFCNFRPCRLTHACSHCGGPNHGRASNCNPTLTGTHLSAGQPEVLTTHFVAEKPSDVEIGNKVYVSNMELHPCCLAAFSCKVSYSY